MTSLRLVSHVSPTGGTLVKVRVPDGSGGWRIGHIERADPDAAWREWPKLYRELTGHLPAVSGLASARQTPRQEITP